ncbi:M14 family murein peptide amidase A [Noviherbaspirillum sp. CPCC 100848]|uniref:M14 family murein peptide amidase A n=1 Tax=Noviherbaspirillum album TaxID=3080276 RepID=A0ABU6J5V1_9BURK|nr:M14 family murein peptide amidase A [Noviherbaspirillum sp. CPCC 100848]MEC4719032.1 M14 family murein peptide amidase A [Noviherbaspirillum sp. CPCC 100848]
MPNLQALRAAAAAIGVIGVVAACLPAHAKNAGAANPLPAKQDWCERVTPRLPGVSVADCRASGLQPTGASSRKGIPILMRTVPAKTARSGEARRVLLLGGIHGDELTAAAIVFHWMKWLSMPEAQAMHWHVVPVMNPDGLLARKPQRVNANGVDLNRNFPTPGWEKDARHYWMKTTGSDPRRFPGQSPLSEPETRWLDEEMERFRPDVIISVHAPFGVLDLDGPAKAPRSFGRLYFNRVGIYPGSLGNYGGMHKNVPVITIELPNALAMPKTDESRRIWTDMLAWIGRSVPPQKSNSANPGAPGQQGPKKALVEH